jgi:hypothetical protein
MISMEPLIRLAGVTFEDRQRVIDERSVHDNKLLKAHENSISGMVKKDRLPLLRRVADLFMCINN